jgi:hypothetical protein
MQIYYSGKMRNKTIYSLNFILRKNQCTKIVYCIIVLQKRQIKAIKSKKKASLGRL